MQTEKIMLNTDGTSTQITKGSEGYTIVQNKSNGIVYWNSDNSDNWHTLDDNDILKIGFDIYVKSSSKYESFIIVTK